MVIEKNSLNKGKRTKIVATIGPASDSKEKLREIIAAGMNVARLNFSHGTYEWHEGAIKTIRELAVEMKRPIGIIADLQGPRIRTIVSEDVEIKNGEYVFVSDVSVDLSSKFQIPSSKKISKNIFLDQSGIVADIKVGENILIEDGIKRLKVIEKEKDFLVAEVVNGGMIKNHKGVNLPDSKLKIGAVTEKDERDLEFALGQDVDFVALSFVGSAKEIEDTRKKMQKILGREPARNATHSVAGGNNLPQIISKIERKEAISNLDEIIKASDVVMVARGDLGIEMDETKVVIYQKQIIAKCLAATRPVIVATQMLDSMIENPIPTRAEVSDVSNAVIDHTDAVMLSGETANGKFPVKAVETMADIARSTEQSPFDDVNCGFLDEDMLSDYSFVISSAHGLARGSKARAIFMFSESGITARMMSHHRPEQLLVCATNNPKTYNQLSMVWGIRAYLFTNGETRENFINLLIEKTKKDGKLKKGDKIVIVLGKIPRGPKMKLIGIQEVE